MEIRKLAKPLVQIWTGLAFTALTGASPGLAQDARGGDRVGGGFVDSWFARVTRVQSEQPAWMTPVFTTTPRLDEELHYDVSYQSNASGHLLNYGNGRGLELIPYDNIQLNIGIPAYETHTIMPHRVGWSDESFLVKYRLMSANERNGNYVVSAFMGLSVPSGSSTYTSHHFVYTPTIAGGKGWGDFDIQSTLGVAVPDDFGIRTGPGVPILFNTSLQYKLGTVIWPDLEFNYTYWPNGVHEGKEQLFISPGVIFGRFPIWRRLRAVVGAGYQIAVTSRALFHNNFNVTLRLPF